MPFVNLLTRQLGLHFSIPRPKIWQKFGFCKRFGEKHQIIIYKTTNAIQGKVRNRLHDPALYPLIYDVFEETMLSISAAAEETEQIDE